MMRWRRDSLKARLLLILLVSIAMLQVLSFGAVGWWRGYEARHLVNAQIAQDVLWLRTRVAALPLEQRAAALPALQRATYRPLLADLHSATPGSTTSLSPELHALHRAVVDAAEGAFEVSIANVAGQPALRLPLDGVQALLIAFEDGLPSTRPNIWAALAYVLVVTLVVALVSMWAVTQVTEPLARLSQAGRELAQDIASAEPLPESGSYEARELAAGFNAMQRAVQAQLRERTHILAAVSHDLKTPLTRLKLRVDGLPDSPERARMEADMDVMDGLINEGLEFARSAQLREELLTLDLAALLESLVEQAFDLGQECTFHPPEHPVPVRAAPRALTRWVQNLLDNALRYGGSADVSLHAGNDGVEVRIADRGPGLAKADLERMFEPFVRGEKSRGRDSGGTGLGLAIARNIAHSLGGRTWLSARPGGGVVAHMWLPPANQV